LENFFQFSKCYRDELTEDGTPGPKFRERQRIAFADPMPHRHKRRPMQAKASTKRKADGSEVIFKGKHMDPDTVPVFWAWTRKDGSVFHASYVESRQFYCNYYERLASVRPEFLRLKKMLADGTNLAICGYDGRESGGPEADYLDPTQPFGHEMVLHAMLTIQDPNDYPWRRHKTEDF
jgi:hypothetical protein